jgi:hypothetical protein
LPFQIDELTKAFVRNLLFTRQHVYLKLFQVQFDDLINLGNLGLLGLRSGETHENSNTA